MNGLKTSPPLDNKISTFSILKQCRGLYCFNIENSYPPLLFQYREQCCFNIENS